MAGGQDPGKNRLGRLRARVAPIRCPALSLRFQQPALPGQLRNLLMQGETAAVAAERAASLAAPQWVVFACDGHWLAFPITKVREILPPREFTRLPGTGPEVCGLVGLRGRIVTVLDLGAIIGLRPSAAHEDHRLVLLEHDGRVIGMAVDSMVAVTRAAARDLSLGKENRAVFDIEKEEVIGVGSLEGRPFTALDPAPMIRRLLD